MMSPIRFGFTALLVALAATVTQAAPSASRSRAGLASKVDVVPRAAISTIHGNQIASTESFTLYNNPWGEKYATGGDQTTYLDAAGKGWIAWQSAWTWEGGDDYVKSYANAVLNGGPTQLSTITSMPTSWNWTYSGQIDKGDVSYDAFLSAVDSTSQADQKVEVMIWLAAYGGATPIGSPVATVQIDGINWQVWQGTNEYWTVFSFLAPSTYHHFSGDIKHFFNYLTATFPSVVPASYYLQTIGAGTEPFTGSNAWFTVSPYTLSMKTN
ncbi:xyloglucan-specific endo-beta-1-4-glucanase A [Penicillium hispanicum]|uniref:xyloglucan-specific endo-beta-1-4-glucanase A n=1 Tax=Penicillium hispanicum TaxID=1080232 RepID=UPI002540A681|nr:xyloglucan-specific endo-beta-1-4-glucanase A [Penicillium hispanicum]KAJ5584990.1 xyloglucan-specific endo-beta-1-4-glucanase A [Penicillium hispanicum]